NWPEPCRTSVTVSATETRPAATALERARRLEERRPQLREALLQLGRHLLDRRLTHEAPQLHLEAVALRAIRTEIEVRVRLGDLGVAQRAVEVRLHDLLAPRARIDREARHVAATGSSASWVLRIRRPR